MGLGLGATGCATSLDMASAFDAARPATTIPYTGVRGSARRFPDYSPIDRSILVTGGTKPKGSGPR